MGKKNNSLRWHVRRFRFVPSACYAAAMETCTRENEWKTKWPGNTVYVAREAVDTGVQKNARVHGRRNPSRSPASWETNAALCLTCAVHPAPAPPPPSHLHTVAGHFVKTRPPGTPLRDATASGKCQTEYFHSHPSATVRRVLNIGSCTIPCTVITGARQKRGRITEIRTNAERRIRKNDRLEEFVPDVIGKV